MSRDDVPDIAPDNSLAEMFEELQAFYAELAAESQRAAAILAATMLEDELETLIRLKFPENLSNAKWKRIAGGGPTPFGNMKAKTDVAEAFGFYGPKTHKTINTIAEVRNKFAHRQNVRSFDHPAVMELCQKLSDNPVAPYTLGADPTAQEIREEFIWLVRNLTSRLMDLRWHIPFPEFDPPEPLP